MSVPPCWQTLPNDLPPPPPLRWQSLAATSADARRHFWQLLDQHGRDNGLWDAWSGTLIDSRSGDFASAYMQGAVLLDASSAVVALVAEAEAPGRRGSSEVVFAVLPDWRGLGLGRLLLEAALLLARRRGSERACFEFGRDNAPCLALCRQFGAYLPGPPARHSLRAEVALSRGLRWRFYWRKLCRRRSLMLRMMSASSRFAALPMSGRP